MDDLLAELEEARKAALTAETAQSSAAVAATMGKAKLLGLYSASELLAPTSQGAFGGLGGLVGGITTCY